MGPIHLLRRRLPLVSIFQCSLFSLCLGCAWLKHRPPALARQSVVLVPVRKFCMSVVDTLTLQLCFLSTGSGVPIPGCLFTGFLGPDAWLFPSWVLGSHSLAVLLSFHHLSTVQSSQSPQMNRALLLLGLASLLLSLPLTLFPLVVFATFSLSLLWLLSCRSAHRVPMNRSTSHLARGTTVIFLPAVLLPNCCSQHCSTGLCRLLSLLTTTSLFNHAHGAQTCRRSST